MPIVAKQDNVDNLYAIWSTVTDRFLGVNIGYNECVETVMKYKGCSYEDAKERADCPQPFDDIAKQIHWVFEPDYAVEEPDDIKNAVRLIVNHYKTSKDFRNAFISSIESALEEFQIEVGFMDDGYNSRILAERVSKRIIGEE